MTKISRTPINPDKQGKVSIARISTDTSGKLAHDDVLESGISYQRPAEFESVHVHTDGKDKLDPDSKLAQWSSSGHRGYTKMPNKHEYSEAENNQISAQHQEDISSKNTGPAIGPANKPMKRRD